MGKQAKLTSKYNEARHETEILAGDTTICCIHDSDIEYLAPFLTAPEMLTALENLLDNPTPKNLAAAQQAMRKAKGLE